MVCAMIPSVALGCTNEDRLGSRQCRRGVIFQNTPDYERDIERTPM